MMIINFINSTERYTIYNSNKSDYKRQKVQFGLWLMKE